MILDEIIVRTGKGLPCFRQYFQRTASGLDASLINAIRNRE